MCINGIGWEIPHGPPWTQGPLWRCQSVSPWVQALVVLLIPLTQPFYLVQPQHNNLSLMLTTAMCLLRDWTLTRSLEQQGKNESALVNNSKLKKRTRTWFCWLMGSNRNVRITAFKRDDERLCRKENALLFFYLRKRASTSNDRPKPKVIKQTEFTS